MIIPASGPAAIVRRRVGKTVTITTPEIAYPISVSNQMLEHLLQSVIPKTTLRLA